MYPFWIARYPLIDNGTIKLKLSPETYAVSWQYSSKGRVNGISGNVDMNISFKNLVELMKCESSYINPERPILKLGSKGIFVTCLQMGLKGADLYHGKVDGVFGPVTKKALIEWQELVNVTKDGVCGPVTWKSFGM
jgi:peptidoglycan hydrolase-like protein with peptidoglycan-binding domain